MEKYSLTFRKSVAKDLRVIPDKDVESILASIGSLANNPRPPGCVKLTGQEHYRIRQGNYRIVYEITDRELTVIIIKVAHRRDVYRQG